MGTTLRRPKNGKQDRSARNNQQSGKSDADTSTYTGKEYAALAKEYQPEYINGYTYAF